MSKKNQVKSDTFYYPNGDTYTGEYKVTPDLVKHGSGTYFSSQTSTLIKGTWKEDTLVIGDTILTFNNGDKFIVKPSSSLGILEWKV